MSVKLRPANLSDLPNLLIWGKELHVVEKTFEPRLKYSESEAETRYTKQLGDDNILFIIAELDNTPVGYLYAHIDMIDYLDTDRPVCEIKVVYIDPIARGKGMAQLLISQAKEWALTKNCIEIKSGIFADNQCSRKAFEKAGFTPRHITYSLNMD